MSFRYLNFPKNFEEPALLPSFNFQDKSGQSEKKSIDKKKKRIKKRKTKNFGKLSEDSNEERQEESHSSLVNEKYKTELCKYYDLNKGKCKFGDKCSYAHGKENLRPVVHDNSQYKINPCRQFFEKGYCTYGTRCQFYHTRKNTSKKLSYVDLLDHIKSTEEYERVIKRLPIFVQISM